jgi:hypothetical protein
VVRRHSGRSASSVRVLGSHTQNPTRRLLKMKQRILAKKIINEIYDSENKMIPK